MSERMRESLSALMDDEANELEVQRLLSGIGEDVELRQTWMRYNAVRSTLSGQRVSSLSLDISGRVREALVEEGNSRPASKVQGFLKPFVSFAVAASVAAVVVVGGLQLSQIDDSGSYPPVASTFPSAPVGMVNSPGALAIPASYGNLGGPVLRPTDRKAYEKLASQRMQKYMQEHAEHAALNSPQGLVPFARVQEIKE